MTIKVKVIGTKRLQRKFRGLPDTVVKHLRLAVATSAKQVEGEILRSMRKPKSGIVYRRGKGRNLSPTHRASKKGEAPAVDTGFLIGSIAVKIEEGGLAATIGVHEVTKVKYAIHLELGTQNIKPRPFVFPAFEKSKKTIKNRWKEAVNAAEKEIIKR